MKNVIAAVSLFVSLIAAQDSCSLCPGGSQNYTADKAIYALEGLGVDINAISCGDLAGLAPLANSSDTCEFIQAHAAWCKCAGVEPTCTLCPNGTAPVDANIMVPFYNATCELVDYIESVSTAYLGSTDCAPSQDFANFCGCPGVTLNETCTFCPNGETTPSPDAIFPFDVGTCAEIEVVAPLLALGDLCMELQAGGVIACGCSPANKTATGNCTMCADGSSIPNPDKTIVVWEQSPPLNITCGMFESSLFLLSDEECPVAPYLAANSCGCTPAASLPVTCPLCEDGTIPSRFFDNADSYTSCYEIAVTFAYEDASSQNCTAVQATAGMYCGCNNTKASQADICRVCGGDMLLPDPAMVVDELFSCGYVEYFTNAGFMNCSEAQSYAPVCCNATLTDAPASTSIPAPAGSSPTVSPASGPPGVQPTSQPVDQPTPPTSGAMASAVMISAFLPMVSIGFGLM